MMLRTATFSSFLTSLFLILIHPCDCLAASSSSPPSPASPLPVETLLARAQSFVNDGETNAAFETLAEIYQQDPEAPGLSRLFEACLRLKVDSKDGTMQDRFGLAALLLDQERYDEASVQLRQVLLSGDGHDNVSEASLEKAASMLFRSNAACCQWDTYVEDSEKLVQSLRLQERMSDQTQTSDVPAVHPFEALKWPCITLSQATQIASLYARRSIASTMKEGSETTTDSPRTDIPPTITVSRETNAKFITNQRIRLGYISPDFTSTHPLAFLMQNVFEHHNRDQFEVKLYSLSKWDEEGPEVQAIQNGSDSYIVLPSDSPQVLAKLIQDDNLDILVDLCGYAGTDRVSQILSLRPAPIQVSYMGFPASSGAPYLDYLVCDLVVVPPELRRHYTELMIYMPHCYFVNSHASSVSHLLMDNDEEKHQELRSQYNLPSDGFIYCCHSRPDKIDPSTFRTWLRALKQARQECDKDCVLWLLRSGKEMETNLLNIAHNEFGLPKEALVFCDVAPRQEHLQRLACADVFLDTPAYNAHTLGCDTLFAGVPMISLLRAIAPDKEDETETILDPLFVDTDKLASRVGASLLRAAGLYDEMVCERMRDYAKLMVKCATDKEWFASVRPKLVDSRATSLLFDTRRWVENLELALRQIVLDRPDGCDIVVVDNDDLNQ